MLTYFVGIQDVKGDLVPARTAVRRPLTRERVVAAAMKVADRDGVDAVTMRRLAELLDVHPTSLYNHLPSKEAILDAVAEGLIAEANLPTYYDHWHDWVRAMAEGLVRVARAHPGAFLVLTQRAASGTAAMEQTEAALDVFRRGGFSALGATRAVTGASLALLGVALNECPPTAPWEQPDYSALDAAQFPRIAESLEVAPELTDGGTDKEVPGLVADALIAGLAKTRS